MSQTEQIKTLMNRVRNLRVNGYMLHNKKVLYLCRLSYKKNLYNPSGDDLHAGVLWRLEERVELQRVRDLPVPALPAGRDGHVLLHRRLPVQEKPHPRV